MKETDFEKQRSAVLVVALEVLEKLEIGTDPGKSRNRDSMEENKVSRVLAEKIAGETRETDDS